MTRSTLIIVALALLVSSEAVAQDTSVSTEMGARGGGSGRTLYDGRIAIRDVFSFDNQTDFDIHVLFLDTDLDFKNLTRVGGGRLNFKLDSRFLLDLTQDQQVSTNEFTANPVDRNERRFGETQTFADVRQLYVELEDLGGLDIQTGRVWIFQAGGAWADGANIVYNFDREWAAGVFGGLQPDPFDYLPTTDRQTAGTYAEYNGERFTSSLAYTATLFEGSLDRHFAFTRGHWNVPVGDFTRSLFLSYFLSVDLPNAEAGVDDPVPTTLFTNASWWVSDNLNFSLHYARFATSRLLDPEQRKIQAEDNQRETLGDVINQGAYNQVRLGAVQRFDHYHVYQQVDFRDRDLLDQASAIYYRAGVRDSSFLNTGLFLHGRLTVRNNFLSDSTEFLIESGYRFGSSFTLDGVFAFQTGRSLLVDQDQDVIFAGARASYDITPDFYLTLDYELTAETNIQQEELETDGDLLVHTIFSRLTYRL